MAAASVKKHCLDQLEEDMQAYIFQEILLIQKDEAYCVLFTQSGDHSSLCLQPHR